MLLNKMGNLLSLQKLHNSILRKHTEMRSEIIHTLLYRILNAHQSQLRCFPFDAQR